MSIRILIADDHAVFRSGLKALLEKEEDLRVVAETGTGPSTLSALEEHDVNVLVLDLSLPGMPGSRVAEAVMKKKVHPAIVVLTMHEDEYYLQELLRIGARAFVLKKSTGIVLVEAIRAVHAGEQFVDPAMAGHVISTYVGRSSRDRSAASNGLTDREREICTLLAYGHTNAEVAAKLSISRRTVDTHRLNIMRKLGLENRADLVRFAIDHGLLRLE